MEKNKKIMFYILLCITVFILAFALTGKTFQNDTFYTIKVGEVIANNGIDMKEHFSFVQNLSYTYPHWLYDFLIYLVYDSFGFDGIYYFTIALAAILFTIVYFTINNILNDKGISYTLLFLVAIGLDNFITARAQIISYILLLLILYSLEKLGGEEVKDKRYILYIFICSLLMANFHVAVWPFIFVLFLPYLVSDFIYFITKKLEKKICSYKARHNLSESRIEITCSRNVKQIIMAFFLSIGTGFLVPNKFVPFTYFIKTKMGITMKYISEHLPVTIEKRPELFIILGILIFLLLLSNMKIKLKDLFLVGGLALLSFMSNRNFSLFVLLSVFCFGRTFKMFCDRRFYTKLYDVLTNIVIFAILFSILVSSAFVFFDKKKNTNYVNYKKYPVEASDYIIDTLGVENIKLYNEYNFGSYLLYRGIPVFIDSRADLYTEEFNPGCTVFYDAMKIYNNYEITFEKYGITHVILYNSNKLTKVLKKDDNFRLVYIDEYFSIFENLTKY